MARPISKVRTENRYGAVIVARNTPDGPQRLADLKGKTFGAVAPDAFGGWQLALHTLRRNGLEPDRDFAELRFFGFPQSAIVHAVLNGDPATQGLNTFQVALAHCFGMINKPS